MADKRGWGTTVLGWFVVQDGQEVQDAQHGGDAPPAAAPDQPAAEPSTFFVSPPPASRSGQVAFDKVFEAAGIAAEERDRVTKTRDLLTTLPPATDAAIKKQIVEASLKAFGVPIDKIIETGAQEIQALEGYIQVGQWRRRRCCAESRDAHPAVRGGDRAASGRSWTARVQEQQALTRACNEQEARGPAGARVLRPGGGGAGGARVAEAARARARRPASGRNAFDDMQKEAK